MHAGDFTIFSLDLNFARCLMLANPCILVILHQLTSSSMFSNSVADPGVVRLVRSNPPPHS